MYLYYMWLRHAIKAQSNYPEWVLSTTSIFNLIRDAESSKGFIDHNVTPCFYSPSINSTPKGGGEMGGQCRSTFWWPMGGGSAIGSDMLFKFDTDVNPSVHPFTSIIYSLQTTQNGYFASAHVPDANGMMGTWFMSCVGAQNYTIIVGGGGLTYGIQCFRYPLPLIQNVVYLVCWTNLT